MSKLIHANPPERCDVCKAQIEATFYDAKTLMGPWANLCPSCWEQLSYQQLGTGFGQKYERNALGTYEKTRG